MVTRRAFLGSSGIAVSGAVPMTGGAGTVCLTPLHKQGHHGYMGCNPVIPSPLQAMVRPSPGSFGDQGRLARGQGQY
jgi:hypothetical protein